MKVTVYDSKFTPAECRGCKKWLVCGDRFIVMQEHPTLGKNYGPFVFHEQCFEAAPSQEGAVEKQKGENPNALRERMLAERRAQPHDAFGDYPKIPDEIISATTESPICVWCSERLTKSPGGSLVEHDGDLWHTKCLERFKASETGGGGP